MNELEGILVATSDQNNTNKARFFFILENASLEFAKVGKVGKLYWIFFFKYIFCYKKGTFWF